MKKSLFICAVCAAAAVTACCGGKQQKVSAIVVGPDKVAAVVVEYAEALDAASVCPEAFTVEGKEVVCAKLVEPAKVVVALKKDCCKAKPECGEPKQECCEPKQECGEQKPECSEPKPECCKEKCEIPVPDVSVKQVIDLKTADGKVVKAWKKAIKATEVAKCDKKPECGAQPCDKPAEEQCPECKKANE